MRLHCIYFLAPEYARELRGAFYYRSLRRGFAAKHYAARLWALVRFDFRKILKPEVHISGDRISMVCPSRCPEELLITCMPFHQSHLEVVKDRKTTGRRVVIDVVGNVWREPGMDSPAMRKAGNTVSQEAWDWWMEGGRLEVLTECIRNAHAVTTPWAEMVPFLQGLTHDEVPVFHVPDLQMNRESVYAFRDNMLTVMRRIGYDIS